MNRATRTILLLTTIFLSLMLLSEAINFAPKVPVIIHIAGQKENDSNSTDSDLGETTGSMTSIDSGKNLGSASLFELLGSPSDTLHQVAGLRGL